MTRINVISPAELTGKHLVAEYRELPRVFGLARAYASRGGLIDDLPPAYVLGTGHVKFFYNKLVWLNNRQVALVDEMKARGYKPHFDNPPWVENLDIPLMWWNDWQPTPEAIELNRARIKERLG